MIKFKKTNYSKLRENLRRDFLEKLEEAIPSSKWNRFCTAEAISTENSHTGLDMIFGILAILAAMAIVSSTEKIVIRYVAIFILMLGCITLIKEAVKIGTILREYNDIIKLLPEWKEAPYDKCVQYAEKYEDHEGACFAASDFLRYHQYLKAMETIEQLEVLDISYNSAGNYMYITYEDKEGNVKEYECPNCEVRKNTSATEPVLEVTEKKLIYTIPYQKEV